MKIYSLTTGAVGYSTRVAEKQLVGQASGQSPDQGREQSQQNSQQNPKDNQEPVIEVSAEDLEKAVMAFQRENWTQSSGLNATVTGSWPGLKVILKDEAGSVVRQLTGEEFLRLRHTAGREGASGVGRGKILDQKL